MSVSKWLWRKASCEAESPRLFCAGFPSVMEITFGIGTTNLVTKQHHSCPWRRDMESGRNWTVAETYPPGNQACSFQNAWSAALLPLKMLRSALRMLATPTGKALRGRNPQWPSPVYCHMCHWPHGEMTRG